MKPDAFIERFRTERGSAILRTPNADVVEPAMEAAIRGGFRIVEFTLTCPDAFEHIRAFASRGDVIVGAGTVMSPDDACRAVDAGASFLVSPVVDEPVIEVAHALGIAMMPGAYTPTEMLRAHRAGAQLVKLFPGPEGGPKHVRSILGPMPFLRIVPTNGVHLNNAGAYLKAGAWAVGFVKSLFDQTELDGGRFDQVEARARKLLQACR